MKIPHHGQPDIFKQMCETHAKKIQEAQGAALKNRHALQAVPGAGRNFILGSTNLDILSPLGLLGFHLEF